MRRACAIGRFSRSAPALVGARARVHVLAIAFAILATSPLFAACTQASIDAPAPLASLDEAFFRCRVEPALAKSCGAFACHGDGRRYFRVFARNRMRAQGQEKDRNAPLTDAERRANFDAARAMLDPASISASWLVMKPLDVRAGGWFHRGAEIFGQGNVYATKDDADWKTIVTWAQGAKDDPACVAPGSDQ